jgi:cytochrome c-type biogenesis protein CcmH/NrfG
VQRDLAGKLTLAAELSSSGLLNSSSALLQSLPSSYQRNLMLARIYYTHHTPSQLGQAAALLNQAVTADPAALPARRLLAAVYADQGNQAAAVAQNRLIAQLVSGRP